MKNRKGIFMFSIALLLSTPSWQSCEKQILLENEPENPGNSNQQVQLTFQLFTPSVSRATSVQDFKKIWVMDMVGNNVRQVVEQDRTSKTFGAPTLNLTNGVHTLHFFATDAETGTLDNDVIRQVPLGDSFYKTLTIDTKNTQGTQKVVLERQVAKIIYTGEKSVTLKGIVNDFQLSKGMPTNNTVQTTLNTDEFIFTYISSEIPIALEDGTQVPVKKNGITVIKSHGDNNTPIVPPENEIMILETDTALFYLSQKEINVESLEKIPNPIKTFEKEMFPYRMPARREAFALSKQNIPNDYWSGNRCLCFDDPQDTGIAYGEEKLGTGQYFTFKWNNEGLVTLAGKKTPYCIKPIRSVPIALISISTNIDADFTWDSDTTVVN